MKPKTFLLALLTTTAWINFVEIMRYTHVLLPDLRHELSGIENISDMSWETFAIWILWNSILTTVLVYTTHLVLAYHQRPFKSALIASILVWSTFFLLYWIWMYNTEIAPVHLVLIALIWTYLQMFTGARIAIWVFNKCEPKKMAST